MPFTVTGTFDHDSQNKQRSLSRSHGGTHFPTMTFFILFSCFLLRLPCSCCSSLLSTYFLSRSCFLLIGSCLPTLVCRLLLADSCLTTLACRLLLADSCLSTLACRPLLVCYLLYKHSTSTLLSVCLACYLLQMRQPSCLLTCCKVLLVSCFEKAPLAMFLAAFSCYLSWCVLFLSCCILSLFFLLIFCFQTVHAAEFLLRSSRHPL
ncbi:hypothetical protein Tco_1396771 [Tanacetum coccineum]